MHNSSAFDQLVAAAAPYALQCGNIDEFSARCAQEVLRSGEPAFFLTTRKHLEDSKRFPIALEMHGYDDDKKETIIAANMDISRPDYTDNPDGFKGNHLVVALLNFARYSVNKECQNGIEILTSQAKWQSLIHGPGYQELKLKRILNTLIAEPNKPLGKKSRL